MILGFKQQFEDLIKTGSKIHTIRADKPNRWKPGMLIHFAKGVRTKNYINFHMGFCHSVQRINIEYVPYEGNTKGLVADVFVSIDGRRLNNEEVRVLAKNDGFQSASDFLNFFDKDFTGKIIHWTDFRYEVDNETNK